jgi:hypothetical protein
MCQPAVHEHIRERGDLYLVELDEHCCVAVEVGDREEGERMSGEHGSLLIEVGDPDREDGASRGLGWPHAFHVRPAEGPFPGECLPRDVPGPLVTTLTFGNLREGTRKHRDVIEVGHEATIPPASLTRTSPSPTCLKRLQ